MSPADLHVWGSTMNRSLVLKYVVVVAVFSSALFSGYARAQHVLEEVVVVARKQSESLLEAPVAVSVLTDEFFDRSGFNTMTDIVRFVPGFDYSPTNTTRANGTRIRGISTFSFSDGFESSVATVIDGVVMGREAQGFFDLYDIESVEVIKGPQGTLFGKNASAGVVNVRTKKPEYDFSIGGDAMVGSYGEQRYRGTVTGALIEDTLAYRITGSSHSNDGYIDNNYPGQDDINDKDTWSVRAKFLYEPNENLEALLTVDTVREDNACCLATYRTTGEDLALIAFAYTPNVFQLQEALDLSGITPGDDNRDVAILDDRINQESEASGISLEVNYEMENGQFTSITAWREWEIDEFNEADQLTITDINNRNGTESDTEQFSQEFRWTGSINESANYVAGLYYFHEDLDADGTVFVEIGSFGLFNSSNRAFRSVETTNYSAFGEITWDVSEQFSLIVGARYTSEEKEAEYTRVTAPINPFLPFSSVFGIDFSGEQKVDDNDFSGRIIGRYNISENVNTYLTWSRGYKGAGIDVAESANPAVAEDPGGLPVAEPEIPTLWELGFKGWFLDDTLAINTALFYQSVENLQTILISTDSAGGAQNESIGEVLAKGLEADLTYLTPVDGLTLSGSLTWLDVKYEEHDTNPALEGEDFQDIPEFALSFVTQYDFELGSGWDSFVRAEYTWQDDKNTRSTGEPRFDVDDYGLLNVRFGTTSPSGKYKVTLAVENATDEDYPYFIGGSSYSAVGSTSTSQYLAPDRLVRLTLGAQF